MTVISLTALQLKPGVIWEEAQKSLKQANDLVRKHGGENVGAMVSMAAGPDTGRISLIYTTADWASYGKLQDALMADPEIQALMTDPNSPTAGWDTYVMQTIPDL
jgi:hypothetical protein